MRVEFELIDRIYDAAVDPSRWQKFLDGFVEATLGTSGSLLIGDPRFDDYSFACCYGVTQDQIQEYWDRYAASDEFRLRIRDMPEGYIAPTHIVWAEEEMVQSLAYRGFYGAHNWHYGLGGIILRTATSVSLITSLRGKEQGPCDEPELSLLGVLMPHLRRAALLHAELTSLRAQQAAFAGQMDQLSYAFLMLDAERHVLYANAPARQIARDPEGVHIEHGFLKAESPTDEALLKRTVSEIADNRNGSLRRLNITRSSGKAPYRLVLVPLPSSAKAPFGIALPEVAALIFDTESAQASDAAGLQEWFNLTPSEARVADFLVRGLSVNEIAGELCVSVETVRTHVRRTLSKTSTNRQGELVSLILRTLPGQRF